MMERSRPRDLYDIVNLFRRPEFSADAPRVHRILVAKCEHKGIDVPTLDALDASPFRAELQSEWGNMLAHQLPALRRTNNSGASCRPCLSGWRTVRHRSRCRLSRKRPTPS